MFLMFTVTAPLSKGIDVTKTFLKAVETPPPPYLRSRGVYTTYGDEGYKWYNLVEVDDNKVSEGFTELMKRTVPFDGIEGLKVKVEILESMRTAVEVVYPKRITTGYKDLDEFLYGGIPQNYAVALTSHSCDERELLIKRFLEAGAKNGQTTFHVAIEALGVKSLAEEFQSNFNLFICNPQADLMIESLPNVSKLNGLENLTDIDLALTKALSRLETSMSCSRRACIEIVSDVLLQHDAVTTRKWLARLIPELRSKGFTTLAVINPQMHSSEQVHALLGLFEGEISIYEKETPKGPGKFLKVKKMLAQRYFDEELPLNREKL